ncbi:MAG: MFS transporter [Jannaschia sp.]
MARMSMSYQFQSVAALSPTLIEDIGLSIADIGLLIGIYLAPGVVVAIPGATISARFGDKRVVALSMVMMLLGMALMAAVSGWPAMVVGRVLAGAGGVVLNVVMTKMVVDWFAGREISTAMAIFINSWPVGIAVALLTLPGIAAAGGLPAAWLAVSAMIGVTLALFVAVYRPAPGAAPASPTITARRFPVAALLFAALVWALYNTALAMVFGFGPAYLAERGASPESAGVTISLFMVVFAVAVPLGGVIADRSGRRDTVIAVSLVTFSALIPLLMVLPLAAAPALLLAVGFLFGLGAGPMVGLPANVLTAEARTFAMGVYFTIYYGWMMIAPSLIGTVADRYGTVAVAMIGGAAMSALALLSLGAFRRITRVVSVPA